MRYLFLSLLILYPPIAICSNKNKPTGARSFAMGNASVALYDVWSVFNNQAGLALQKQKSFGAFYENRFTNEDLSTKSFYVVFPSNLGSFAGSYSQFGFDIYKESTIGIAYSRALGDHFWTGLQFNQIQKKLNSEYGSQSQYTFEFGVLSEIAPKLFLGFHIANPTQEKFKTWDYDEKIATVGRLGISCELSNRTIISTEFLKILDSDLQFKSGMEYPVNEKLHIRAGFHNHPNSISLGLGFSFSRFTSNIAFSRHPVLGYTPTADINFRF